MGWFRKNLRIGSRLALLAVAIQLALTFAHVHSDGDLQAHQPSALLANADQSASALASPPATTDDPVCAICVLIQLASASAAAVAPVLDLPQHRGWILPVVFTARLVPAAPVASFNARAPPFA